MIQRFNRADLHQRIFFILIMCVAFCIPVYGRLLPPLIALLVLNWLVEGRYIKTLPLLFREKSRIKVFSFSILYFFYILGLVYSKNLDYGFFDLEVKLSLFIFPLIFSTTEISFFNNEKVERILKAFISGCIAGTLILFGHALYRYLVLHEENIFYYSQLSWSFHPSYMAMYLTFAVSILTLTLMIKDKMLTGLFKAGLILLILYFLLFIILLSSKAGLLGFLATMVLYTLILIFKYHRLAYGLVLSGATILVLYFGLKLFPFASGRISQAGKDITEEGALADSARSTSDRVAMWKASFVIIQNNWIFGVGTGDVKDELYKEYKKRNIVDSVGQRMNSHNQYLQTFITLGLPGIFILISLLVFPGIQAFRNEHWIYFTLLVIFGMNIFVESMLEAQQGVIFYAFFNTLLFAQKK